MSGQGQAPPRNIPPPPPGFPGAPPPTFIPPVPPPWTEHRAPGGQPYWFNPQTNVSTYVRPMPPVPPPPAGFPPMMAGGPPPFHPGPVGPGAQGPPPAKKEKKEKPKTKEPVEGTAWVRVTTNKGNVFFTNTETKQSVWTVPDEIREAVEEMDRKSRDDDDGGKAATSAAAGSKKRKVDEVKQASDEEAEISSERAASKDIEAPELDVEVEAGDGGEAKPLETERPDTAGQAPPVPDAEEVIVEPKKKKPKKAKVVREIEELEQDEEWQRQIAAEMAQEAEDQEKAADAQTATESGANGQSAPETGPASATAPAINVSDEEAAAMFKAMLSEKDIEPMAPWDMELPKFINDPRYLAVKQLRVRRDLFDEFCKAKIREQRAAKKRAAESAGAARVDPLTAYRDLLLAHVTSTRTHFSDFKKAHARDPRFRDFGKTEGDKEKVFRQWLRELGERKRADAERAERNFVDMLREDTAVRKGDKWADVKVRHVKDSRYQAVTSSSLRESLFNKYVTGLSQDDSAPDGAGAAHAKDDRAARAAASLKEREAQVRAQKERVSRSADVAKGALGREEGEREFGSMLVDLIRDHEARWEDAVSVLSRDSRFNDAALPAAEQRRLFDTHLRTLYNKRLQLVEEQFAAHSPTLVTPFEELVPSVRSSPHVEALVHGDEERLRGLFDSWRRRQYERARSDFTDLLRESPIIEHWGRLQKKALEEGQNGAGASGKIGMAHEGDDGSDDDDDVPSLTEMAKQVDIGAIHKTLKNDKRYTRFNHDPESRDKWVKDYLGNLAAPKQTVHQRG